MYIKIIQSVFALAIVSTLGFLVLVSRRLPSPILVAKRFLTYPVNFNQV